MLAIATDNLQNQLPSRSFLYRSSNVSPGNTDFLPRNVWFWLSFTDADQTRLGEQVFIGLANFGRC